MKNEKMKIEIENRKFIITKFSAVTAIKVARTVLEKLIPSLSKIDTKSELTDSAKFLDMMMLASQSLTNEELTELISTCLYHIFEDLPGCETRVLNYDGSYGVLNVEYDPLLVIRLVTDIMKYNFKSFLDANRLNSMLNQTAEASSILK